MTFLFFNLGKCIKEHGQYFFMGSIVSTFADCATLREFLFIILYAPHEYDSFAIYIWPIIFWCVLITDVFTKIIDLQTAKIALETTMGSSFCRKFQLVELNSITIFVVLSIFPHPMSLTLIDEVKHYFFIISPSWIAIQPQAL